MVNVNTYKHAISWLWMCCVCIALSYLHERGVKWRLSLTNYRGETVKNIGELGTLQ